MIIHRLKSKTCEVLEVYWIFVGFNKNFMVYVFLVTLQHLVARRLPLLEIKLCNRILNVNRTS